MPLSPFNISMYFTHCWLEDTYFQKENWQLKGITPLQMAKYHVFVLMQICYPYIVWNFPKFQENHVSSFWDMGQSMSVIAMGK